MSGKQVESEAAQVAVPGSINGTPGGPNAIAASLQKTAALDVPPPPPTQVVPSASARKARPLVMDAERKLLYGILAVVLIYLLVALTLNVIHMANVYAKAEIFVKQEVTAQRLDPNRALHHLEGIMATHIIGTHKSAALTLSFIVVVLGALLVVKGAEASYELRLHGKDTKSELITSSPGLVMITLALGLALGVVLHTSRVDIDTDGSGQHSESNPRMQQHRVEPEPPPAEELRGDAVREPAEPFRKEATR
jgi:hypothetical protein